MVTDQKPVKELSRQELEELYKKNLAELHEWHNEAKDLKEQNQELNKALEENTGEDIPISAIEDELSKWYNNEISYIATNDRWMVQLWSSNGEVMHSGHGDDIQDALNTALPNALGRRVKLEEE